MCTILLGRSSTPPVTNSGYAFTNIFAKPIIFTLYRCSKFVTTPPAYKSHQDNTLTRVVIVYKNRKRRETDYKRKKRASCKFNTMCTFTRNSDFGPIINSPGTRCKHHNRVNNLVYKELAIYLYYNVYSQLIIIYTLTYFICFYKVRRVPELRMFTFRV